MSPDVNGYSHIFCEIYVCVGLSEDIVITSLGLTHVGGEDIGISTV